jgi:NDP-sugar pyrophosphorylase family protein
VRFIPPVFVEAGARIGPHCAIGPRVYVERDVCIGDHTRLADVMVLAGASVPPGVTLTHRLVAPDLPVYV